MALPLYPNADYKGTVAQQDQQIQHFYDSVAQDFIHYIENTDLSAYHNGLYFLSINARDSIVFEVKNGKILNTPQISNDVNLGWNTLLKLQQKPLFQEKTLWK